MVRDQDKLIPIAPELWPELKNKFKRDWPRNEVPYNTIQNYINWIEKDPRIKQLEILSLNDSWRDNGTFIVLDRYCMFFHTLEESNDSLRRALRLIDWDYSYQILQVHDSFESVLHDIFASCSIETEYYSQSILYQMPKEDSVNLKPDLPQGFKLKKLKRDHVAYAKGIWPQRFEGEAFSIRRLTAWNPSVGLFNRADQIMAWCLCGPTGSIGVLQVTTGLYDFDTEYVETKYKGFVVKAIAKQLAALGMNCNISVNCNRAEDISLFQSLNFERIGFCWAAHTKSKKLVEYGY